MSIINIVTHKVGKSEGVMNKKIIILGVLIGIVLTLFLNSNNKSEEISKTNQKNKLLTMNLEQTAGSGDYKTVTQSNWPTDGYIFNSDLSKCENGSELSWNDTKKAVVVSGNLSDKCYIYFDIALPYTITYPTFKYSTMSGITEAKAGEKVNITVNFEKYACDGNYQIIGYPTSITDLSCNEEYEKWFYELEDGKINTRIDLTCQFSMPAENVEFTNIQDAGRCLEK